MKNSKPRIKFSGRAKEFLCLNSYISIVDNKKVIVENCKQILECNEVLARVLTGSFEVEIWGSGLMMNSYDSESVEVCGRVESVSLTARRLRERE